MPVLVPEQQPRYLRGRRLLLVHLLLVRVCVPDGCANAELGANTELGADSDADHTSANSRANSGSYADSR